MRYRQQVQRGMDARTNGNLVMTLGYLASLARKNLPPIGIVHSHIYNDPNQ